MSLAILVVTKTYESFSLDDLYHRDGGPAISFSDIDEWYLNGVFYKRVNKKIIKDLCE